MRTGAEATCCSGIRADAQRLADGQSAQVEVLLSSKVNVTEDAGVERHGADGYEDYEDMKSYVEVHNQGCTLT